MQTQSYVTPNSNVQQPTTMGGLYRHIDVTSSVVARLEVNATGEQVAIVDVSLDASANYLAGQFGTFKYLVVV